MTTTAVGTRAQVRQRRQSAEDADYLALHGGLHGWLKAPTPLFTSNATGLWDAFLSGLPAARRQHYTCRACQRFVEHFGGLIEIGNGGAKRSVFWRWAKAPGFFAESIRAMDKIVSKARVTGVFLCDEPVWGLESNRSAKAESGAWTHLHCKPPTAMIHKPGALLTTSQVMAEKVQDFGTLSRGLAEFPLDVVRQAHTLLTTGGLYRSEKCIGVAKWLLDLHVGREAHKPGRENLTWLAVAEAPPGWCHVRSTMIGTLLEDIAAGNAFEDIKRSFDAKMSPIGYQRPQSAPTSGQIAAAEAAIAKLASAGSLARRYARLDEVIDRALWKPAAAKPETASGGVFGHLRPKQPSAQIEAPPMTMTWDKFARTVLPEADRVEVLVPPSGAFFAFVTAEDMSAPPILQWDTDEARNPVSWYLYHTGSSASARGLQAHAFADVTAITKQPSGWTRDLAHQGDGAYFLLSGAKDVNVARAGLALFPETLKSDYHGLRAVIEAYSASRKIGGEADATACGICLQKAAERTWNQVFRVTSRGVRVSATLLVRAAAEVMCARVVDGEAKPTREAADVALQLLQEARRFDDVATELRIELARDTLRIKLSRDVPKRRRKRSK